MTLSLFRIRLRIMEGLLAPDLQDEADPDQGGKKEKGRTDLEESKDQRFGSGSAYIQ